MDWLYPSKCSLCGQIGHPPICLDCSREFVPAEDKGLGTLGELDWTVSLYQFDGRAAQAVRRLKYNRITSLAAPLSALMETARHDVFEHDVIVPVPIHPSRRRMRGFNQADLLCSKMPKDLVATDHMLRVKKTRPQVELTAKQRLANLHNAFVATSAVGGKRVLIIDDVLTTGGTAVACAAALKKAGAIEVGLLSFCGEKSHFGTE